MFLNCDIRVLENTMQQYIFHVEQAQGLKVPRSKWMNRKNERREVRYLWHGVIDINYLLWDLLSLNLDFLVFFPRRNDDGLARQAQQGIIRSTR